MVPKKISARAHPVASDIFVPAEAANRLKATLAALSDLCFILDRQGRILDYRATPANQPFLPPRRFLGRKMTDVLPEPAAGIVRKALARAARCGRSESAAYPLPYRVGERWFEASIAVQGSRRSRDRRFIYLARDVTERVRAERALRESERMNRMLTESMKDVVWVLDLESRRFVYVSPSIVRLRGYTPAEIMARPLKDAWVPEQRRELEEFTRKTVADFLAGRITSDTYVTYEMLQPRKDGSTVPSEVVAHVVRNPQTGRLEAHGVTRDVSERKRLEAVWRESEKRFAESARQSRTYLWEIDAAGLYTYVSPVVADVLGYAPEEIAGKMHFHDLFPPALRAQLMDEILSFINRRRSFRDFENPLLAKDGRTVWVITSAIPQQAPDGSFAGYRGSDTDITERKEAELALRESAALRSAICDNLPDGMVFQMDSGRRNELRRYTYVSEGAQRLHGVSAAELVANARTMYRQMLKEDAARVVALESRARTTMTPFHVEVRFRMPSGEIRWRHIVSAPRKMPNGHVVWDGVELDVTERKQTEETLKRSEAKYRQLYAAMRDPFATTDLKGRLLECNPAFLDLLGYERAELLGRNSRDVTPRKWHAREKRIVREQVHKRGYSSVYEKEYVRKDGSVVPVEVRTMLVYDDAGCPVGMSAVVRDISERKRTEQALRAAHDELEQRVRARTAELEKSRAALARSEEQFRQMANIIDEAFWLIDAQTWEILYVSPAFYRIWNRSAKTLDQRISGWLASIHPEDRERVAKAFAQGMQTGVPGTITYRLICADGSIRWIESSGSMIRDRAGKPLRAAGVLRDVTERRKLEAEILNAGEAERQRIGRDLHDSLGQSLTGIGYLAEAVRESLARRHQPEAAELQKLSGLIGQTADEAHALAQGLLLADLKRGGLGSALQELAYRTQELFGAACRYAGPAAVPLADAAAAGQLYRIAQEAAANAAKHSRANTIVIRLTNTPAGLHLAVRDDGRGLATTKSRNGGLGLDIMRYRAGLIGAALWIDSTRNRGTTVHCLVPLSASRRRPKRENQTRP